MTTQSSTQNKYFSNRKSSKKIARFLFKATYQILNSYYKIYYLLKILREIKNVINNNAFGIANSIMLFIIAPFDIVSLIILLIDEPKKIKREWKNEWVYGDVEDLKISSKLKNTAKFRALIRSSTLLLRILLSVIAILVSLSFASLVLITIFSPSLLPMLLPTIGIVGLILAGATVLHKMVSLFQTVIDNLCKNGKLTNKIFEPSILSSAGIFLSLLSFTFGLISFIVGSSTIPLPITLTVLSILSLGGIAVAAIAIYKTFKNTDFQDKGKDYVEKRVTTTENILTKLDHDENKSLDNSNSNAKKSDSFAQQISRVQENPSIKMEISGKKITIKGSKEKVNAFLGLLKERNLLSQQVNNHIKDNITNFDNEFPARS